MCIAAALVVIVVSALGLPKAIIYVSFPLLLIGFGFQLAGFWQERPTKKISSYELQQLSRRYPQDGRYKQR
jgi:hypothetical protein